MTHYYSAQPCHINAYREDTKRVHSSSGVTLVRVCHKCGK